MTSREKAKLAVAFLALSSALAGSRYEDGAAGGLPWLAPHVQRGVLPYVTVYRLDRMWEAKREEASRGSSTKSYEWHIPASTVEGSRAVSRDILLAWQRLEERGYWVTMTSINYSIGKTEAECIAREVIWNLLGYMLRLNPKKPEVKVGTPQTAFPKGYTPPLPLQPAASEGAHRIDWYSYYYSENARVPPWDYCWDAGWVSIPFFPMIPGWKLVTPLGLEITSPNYPNPLWINMGELEARARKGMERMTSRYVADYEIDIAKAIAPRGDPASFAASLKNLLSGTPGLDDPEVYLPTAWSSHGAGLGAVVTPVIRWGEIPQAAQDLQDILALYGRSNFGDDLLNTARYAYFQETIENLGRRLGISISLPTVTKTASDILKTALIGDKYRDDKARGIWPLEEAKRWFPPSLFQIHEALGYTTYHQVFGKVEATTLPDPKANWAPGEYAGVLFMRSLHIWHVPIIIDCRVPRPPFMPCPAYPDLANIRPIPIAPYTVFYGGPRYYWDWVSVPDSYPIPRVEGLPLPILPLPKR
uniref:Uncharacterized protein n=1 Tax=Thermus caliditerrae TaxID=1330700 RepID=A0A7C5VGV3_9DEIN